METTILPLVAVWVGGLTIERSHREGNLAFKVIGYLSAVYMLGYALSSSVLRLMEYFA